MQWSIKPGLRLAVAAVAVLAASGAASQATFPSKPVRVIIGFPAGSSTDVLGRALANKMGQLSGQQFIVENRPGAGSKNADELNGRWTIRPDNRW